MRTCIHHSPRTSESCFSDWEANKNKNKFCVAKGHASREKAKTAGNGPNLDRVSCFVPNRRSPLPGMPEFVNRMGQKKRILTKTQPFFWLCERLPASREGHCVSKTADGHILSAAHARTTVISTSNTIVSGALAAAATTAVSKTSISRLRCDYKLA